MMRTSSILPGSKPSPALRRGLLFCAALACASSTARGADLAGVRSKAQARRLLAFKPGSLTTTFKGMCRALAPARSLELCGVELDAVAVRARMGSLCVWFSDPSGFDESDPGVARLRLDSERTEGTCRLQRDEARALLPFVARLARRPLLGAPHQLDGALWGLMDAAAGKGGDREERLGAIKLLYPTFGEVAARLGERLPQGNARIIFRSDDAP